MSVAEKDAESQAIRLYREGSSSEALKVLNSAIRCKPESAGLRIVRAIVHHSKADWAAALQDAEVAQALVPLPVGAQLVLADCYANTGREELALTGYRYLMTISPLPPDVYAGLYAGFRRYGHHRLAFNACRAAVEAEPDNHAAYFGMAHCMSSLGYSASYIASVLRTAVQLEPDNPVYRTSLAIQLVSSAQPGQAHAQLCQVPVEALDGVECRCSARKLLELCVWANDERRARKLGEVVRRLAAQYGSNPEDKAEGA